MMISSIWFLPYKHEWLLLLGFFLLGLAWAWWAWSYFAKRIAVASDRNEELLREQKELKNRKLILSGDGKLEPIFKGKVNHVNDLSKISYLSDDDAIELNRLGIYNYEQLSSVGEEDIMLLQASKRWKGYKFQEIKLEAKALEGGKPFKASKKVTKRVTKRVAKKPDKKTTQKKVSKKVIKKATKKVAVAPKKKAATKKVATKGADQKVARSQFKGEDVFVDDRLGVIYRRKPDVVDDLKQIKGVAKVMEKKLHEFGVWKFKQIANWKPAHVEAFAETLGGFQSRMLTDDWIGQAKELAKKAG